MICSEFFELLDNYESITDEQRIEMEKHTAECETCRKELEFFNSIMSNLASIPSPEAPKTLIDRVNAKLDAEKTVVVGFKWNFRVLSTVAACLAIGLAVGINNGYIEKNISDKDIDGVITETVVTNQDEEVPAVDEVEIPDVKDVDVKTLPAQTEEKAKPTSKPVVKPQKAVTPAKSQQESVNMTIAPAKAPENKDAGQVEIKAEEIAVKPVTEEPAPTTDNKNAVDDYAIKSEGYQIAYGKYDVETGKKTTNAFSDYLHVQSDDMGAVVSTMSEMGVKNSGGYYMTSRQNFYALMDKLNDKGVGYECDLQYNSGEKISFRLTYN